MGRESRRSRHADCKSVPPPGGSGSTPHRPTIRGQDGIVVRDHEAEEIIRTVFGEEFPNARLDRVIAWPEKTYDDDWALRAYIVLGDDGHPLDRGALVGFVRHLRPRLTNEAFPVLSFVTQNEAAELRLGGFLPC